MLDKCVRVCVCLRVNEGSFMHTFKPRWFLFWGYRMDIGHTPTRQRLLRVLCCYFFYLILLFLVYQTQFGSRRVNEMMSTVLETGESWAAPRYRKNVWNIDLRDQSLCFQVVMLSFCFMFLVFLEKQLLWWMSLLWEREAPICWLHTLQQEVH